MRPESRPLHRAAATGETSSPHLADGIVERAREGHRTRLRDGFRRNPHLRSSGCLEAYIEGELISSPNMLRRAIYLCVRYPDLEMNISMVAADYGLWNVRAWARRIRTGAFVLLSLVLSGVVIAAGMYKVDVLDRQATETMEAHLTEFDRQLAESLAERFNGRIIPPDEPFPYPPHLADELTLEGTDHQE